MSLTKLDASLLPSVNAPPVVRICTKKYRGKQRLLRMPIGVFRVRQVAYFLSAKGQIISSHRIAERGSLLGNPA